MSRELVYQYDCKANLPDESELIADSVPIPAPDDCKRHGTNYRVTDVSVKNARQVVPRFVVDLEPLDEIPGD